MGLFFKVEDKGKYLLIKRRKHTLAISFLPLVLGFIIFPFLSEIFKLGWAFSLAIILGLFVFIFCMWIACEGIYYGKIFPKKYEEQGKKVERFMGQGIKIYK